MFDFLREKAAQPPPELPKGTVRRRYCVQGVVQGGGSATGPAMPPRAWA